MQLILAVGRSVDNDCLSPRCHYEGPAPPVQGLLANSLYGWTKLAEICLGKTLRIMETTTVQLAYDQPVRQPEVSTEH